MGDRETAVASPQCGAPRGRSGEEAPAHGARTAGRAERAVATRTERSATPGPTARGAGLRARLSRGDDVRTLVMVRIAIRLPLAGYWQRSNCATVTER